MRGKAWQQSVAVPAFKASDNIAPSQHVDPLNGHFTGHPLCVERFSVFNGIHAVRKITCDSVWLKCPEAGDRYRVVASFGWRGTICFILVYTKELCAQPDRWRSQRIERLWRI